MIPVWLIANWRAIAMLLVVGALGAGLLWYRGETAVAELETARAQRDLVEMRGAYQLLAQAGRECSAGTVAAEKAAKEAAQRGARARQEAVGAIEVARRSADALGRVLAAPRVASECVAGDAVTVVRADLAR